MAGLPSFSRDDTQKIRSSSDTQSGTTMLTMDGYVPPLAFLERQRFTKMPFEIVEKLATICGKSFLIQASPNTMVTACKHPRVRIVSRHEDTEYVECLECGDVFDSEEFHDMAIEESAETKEEIEDE